MGNPNEGDVMDELVAWYRACLDDDEKAARDEVDMRKRIYPDDVEVRYQWSRQTLSPSGGYGATVVPGAPSPAAVLADIAAKRAVVDLYEGMAFAAKATTFNGETPDRTLIQAETFARTVRTLARAYRHRPGWKTKWEA